MLTWLREACCWHAWQIKDGYRVLDRGVPTGELRVFQHCPKCNACRVVSIEVEA